MAHQRSILPLRSLNRHGVSVLRFCLFSVLLVLSACEEAPRQESGLPLGTGFDFYVLALSWSPSYCEAAGQDANPTQCNSERSFGFIVHGLWPQFEDGYPEYCQDNPDRVARHRVEDILELVPSPSLVQHQWKKHGTCSGLEQADFFETLRMAHGSVTIPDNLRPAKTHRMVSPSAVRSDFMSANAGLNADGLAVTCDRRRRRLREVRICLTKELEFRGCPQVIKRHCRKSRVLPATNPYDPLTSSEQENENTLCTPLTLFVQSPHGCGLIAG